MTTIYLIRHAEAEGNVYRRCHGHYNSLVTPKGDLQIAELMERFKSVHVDAVYSSDLYRTMKTASAIYKPHCLTLRTDPRLREVAMGVWEDRTFGDIQSLEAEESKSFNRDTWKWQVEGSELFPDAIVRMNDVITEIAKKHDGEVIAIVSHGMAIRAFMCAVLGVNNEAGLHGISQLDNTAVSVFEYDNGVFHMKSYNDISHLSPENSTLAMQKWVKNENGYDDSNLSFVETQPGKFSLKIEKADCGVLELDLAALSGEKIGVITDYKLQEPYRGSGLGIQLLGQATSVYRALGRERLRVILKPDYMRSVAFFERLGFRRISENELEKEIKVNNSDWET